MSRISTHCELRYTVAERTSFAFAVLAAQGQRQRVIDERLTLAPEQPVQRVALGPGGHELVRVVVEPGAFVLTYDATVELSAFVAEVPPSVEVPFEEVPAEVLGFLNPSRYCESDRLTRVAERTFGELEPGFGRVTAICNWVHEHLEYVPGSTDGSSTAVDVLVGGAGVCRDYAHLSIALCRGLGIPARYVSGYAVDLEPPDFHGFFEAYLDGDWYLFDATRMAPLDGLVRIGTGRDAADVAFAALVGDATLDTQIVCTIDLDRTAPGDPTTAAISTA